jgi:hypothetical protein
MYYFLKTCFLARTYKKKTILGELMDLLVMTLKRLIRKRNLEEVRGLKYLKIMVMKF